METVHREAPPIERFFGGRECGGPRRADLTEEDGFTYTPLERAKGGFMDRKRLENSIRIMEWRIGRSLLAGALPERMPMRLADLARAKEELAKLK
jgi:hypothetical protein